MSASPGVTFSEALRFWWKLGFVSFGGPAGQIAIMHRELVERRRWISERRFLHALNYCMVLPGPEAQQLATYIGWLLHGTRGGIAAGALFVLPSLFILVALSWIYARFGQVPAVAAILYGVKPAVVAIVLAAALRIGSKALKHPVLWAIAAAAFTALFAFQVPFPLVILAAALAGVAGVVEVRGMGLMLGVELDRPCGELVKMGLDAGLVFNVTADNVIRLLPALVMSEAEGRQVVERLVPLVKEFLARSGAQPRLAAAR